MEENNFGNKPVVEAINDLKNEIKNSNKKLRYLMCLVLLLTILCGYLCYEIYRSTNTPDMIDSSHSVLIVSLENDLSDSNRSDKTQVRNALSTGGMIRIKPTIEGIDYSMGSTYKSYGASDAEGYHWTVGALMNYIASCGWTFVQAPTSGITTNYYFIR